MPGPARTPTRILALSGSRRAKARARTEPRARPGAPRPPASLDAEGRAIWRRCAKEAAAVLSTVDRAALELWVRTELEIVDCDRKVAELGRYQVIRDERGVVKRQVAAPWVTRRDELARQLVRILAEFGLTPASRSKVSAVPAAPASKLEMFLGGQRGA